MPYRLENWQRGEQISWPGRLRPVNFPGHDLVLEKKLYSTSGRQYNCRPNEDEKRTGFGDNWNSKNNKGHPRGWPWYGCLLLVSRRLHPPSPGIGKQADDADGEQG
jgi:hypothetical protein